MACIDVYSRVTPLLVLCRVAVRNIYFEGTPLNLVSGIVTEDGVLHPSQIGSHADHLRQMYSEAFAIEAIM